MKIDDDVIQRAISAAPEVDRETIVKILQGALAGHILMDDGKGESHFQGKIRYPDYLTVRITKRYVALDFARRLISAVQDDPASEHLKNPVSLYLAGEATILPPMTTP